MAAFNFYRTLDGKVFPETAFKGRLGVIREDILPAGQQPLNLGVALGNEFDDKPGTNTAEETGDPLQRQVIGDGQMVNQCQGQGCVRGAAVYESRPLLILPAYVGAGIGQVHQQRQQMGFAVLPAIQVVFLDTGGINIEGYGWDSFFTGNPAEHAGIGPQIPDYLGGNLV